jgi:guanine nucleotide-binding protein G(i) subunit alpha
MGCGCSSTERQAVIISNTIDERLKKDYEKSKKEITLLLLGAGESGKSTIAKQMRIIHGNGYSPGECKRYRPVVHSNTLHSIFTILQAMKKLEIGFDDLSRKNDITMLFEITSNSYDREINYGLGVIVKRIWTDKGVQVCFSRSNEYQLNDSAGYFLDKISIVAEPNYVPTQQDVLKAQIQTTGIVKTQFVCRSLQFKLYDVGGQRSERKKWIHCFEGVTAVIFCVALSEYDLVLREDSRINRMVESTKLFATICNSKWFLNTPMILFLNKKDLFKEKILKSPLKICFSEYPGPNTYKYAADYIQMRFEDMKENQTRKEVYTHLTCATDTNSMSLVFKDVTDVIIKDELFSLNLL